MKRTLLMLLVALFATVASAQKDVTKFLGIPVDGFKSGMRQKLMAKGYSAKTYDGVEHFEGEFNGTDVNIFIVTNNNKVYRIMVADAQTVNEAKIKIRYNNLVDQFKRNKRYVTFNDYTIPESEDISYEMSVHSKTYDAVFYQEPDYEHMDTLGIQQQVREKMLQKYTQEQLSNASDEIMNEIKQEVTLKIMDLMFKKMVWFRIEENNGEYIIAIYYDNLYNMADGEDL